jgi:DNA repair photolyase
MTVTTDSEEVRQAFEPTCPNNRVRLQAIKERQQAGIDSCITLTPLLPVDDPEQLASDLVETGVSNFVVQPFHAQKGRFVAGTRSTALRVIEKYNWNQERYDQVRRVLKQRIPNLGEGKEGFRPPWNLD